MSVYRTIGPLVLMYTHNLKAALKCMAIFKFGNKKINNNFHINTVYNKKKLVIM